MLEVFKKFGGAIMLYAVVFWGIVAICSNVNYVNQENEVNLDEKVAIND